MVSRITLSLGALAQKAGKGVSIERVYWYLDSEVVPNPPQVISRLSLRACASDDLDGGFELIRAMDADLILRRSPRPTMS